MQEFDHYMIFHNAAQNGNTDVVRFIVEHNLIDVNIPDREGNTPLHYAAKDGHVECIHALVANKYIDVKIQNSNGRTPLHHAAVYSSTGCLKALLSHNEIDVNKQDTSRDTALFLVLFYGRSECVKELFARKDINLSLVYTEGFQPIHFAAVCGNVAMLKAELSKPNMKVNIKTSKSDCNYARLFLARKKWSD